MSDATTNTAILATLQERSPNSVQHGAANVTTKYVTQDVHLNISRKTGSSHNMKGHAVGCEYIHIEANSGQVII
jgi:hypothetical protein